MSTNTSHKKRWTQTITMAMRSPDKGVRLQKNIFISLAVGLLLLDFILSIWAHSQLDSTLRYILRGLSSDMLQVQKTVLVQWHKNEREMVRSWASLNELESAVNRLNSTALNNSPEQQKQSSDYQKLHDLLRDATSEVGYTDFVIANREGTILVAKDHDFVGLHVSPTATSWIAKTAVGELVPPQVSFAEEMYEQNPHLKTQAVIPVAVPIHYQQQYIATLIATINPEQEFNSLFSTIEFSATYDMFAFNDKGYLISSTRRYQSLLDKDLVTNAELTSGNLNVQLRVPSPKGKSIEDMPLTHLAGMALRENQSSGINLNGYRDFAGNEVLGAWVWMDDIGVGLGIEVSKQEADEIMLPLRIIQGAVFIFLAITVLTVCGFAYFNRRLSKRVSEIEELGQYKLVDKIGEGGMGEVFYAHHSMLLRPTAVKLLKANANAEVLARFEKEVRLTSRLTHPNTVEIYDYGMTGSGRFYYAMEYIEGFNLGELLEMCKVLPANRTVQILLQICGSLKEAHDRGIVHRDIKPMNIMLTKRSGFYDQVKVLDFGLVKQFEDEDSDNDLTATQVLRGTPSYIAPERLVNAKCADPRVDIYAVAAIAYNLLTGKDLYSGSTQMEVMSKAMTEMPKEIESTDEYPIPQPLIDLVMRCLLKDPDERIQTMAELLDILKAISFDNEWQQADAKQWWLDYDNVLPDREKTLQSETV